MMYFVAMMAFKLEACQPEHRLRIAQQPPFGVEAERGREQILMEQYTREAFELWPISKGWQGHTVFVTPEGQADAITNTQTTERHLRLVKPQQPD